MVEILGSMHKLTAEVVVIIPVFNDGDRLEKCLEALRRQDLDSSRFIVIAVDNGSHQPPRHLLEKFPQLTLLEELEPGSYCARNCALAAATGKFYAFTDADCVPDSSWLSEALESFATDDDVDAVGGDVQIFCENPEHPTPVEMFDVIKAFPQRVYVEQQNYGVTANLVIRRRAFELVGHFNCALKSGGDKEWCRRLHQSGGKLVFGEKALVRHPARDTLKDYLTKARRVAQGAFARRKTDPETAKFVGWQGILMGLMPPVRRAPEIWSKYPSGTLVEKVSAIMVFYYINAYSAWQKLRCHLGLVGSVERN